MTCSPSPKTTVAIIGGGFSGAAVAYHLAHLAKDLVEVIVFEPRPEIGLGLAYSTDDPVHRINVPASRMTLVPDDESHFTRWLAANRHDRDDCGATLDDGRCFPARSLFGRYVSGNIRPLLENGKTSHVQARIETVVSDGLRWRLSTEDGADFIADIVVVATSHPPPEPPASLTKNLTGHPKFIPDPWAKNALDVVKHDDTVLIVGTGLTMADVVATLDERGHEGHITAISRRGQRSHSHAVTAVEPYGDFLSPPSVTALALLRRVRKAVAEGRPWQGLFDRLRTQGPKIWKSLPLLEQRRLIKHLRPFWDTHRFRIAPQVGAVLDRRINDQMLTISAASVDHVQTEAGCFRVTLRLRNGRNLIKMFDAVIATTGPGHTGILTGQFFLRGLLDAGLLIPDPAGLGLAVDENSRLLGKSGPNPSVFVAGPLARGKFGELMGLPEVTNHAKFVAQTITLQLEWQHRSF